MSDIDLLTSAEAAEAAKMTGDGQAVRLAAMVTGISRAIVDMCGPVVIVTTTNEAHDGGRSFIRPYKTPVDSVASVTEYLGTESTSLTEETNASKPTGGFLLDNPSDHDVRIIRRSGNSDAPFPQGRRNILVTYDAGRFASTAVVDEKFKEATRAILRRLVQREGAAWARGGDPFAEAGTGGMGFFKAVSPMVHEFLFDELKTPAVA